MVITASAVQATDGRLLEFEGDVRVNGEAVTSNIVITRADIVATGDESSAKIVLSDNSIIDLDSNSEIAIKDYSYDPEDTEGNTSDIDVLAGTLRYVSGKIAKDDPEDVSFTAGNSTIGVRGTYISISVCPEDNCQ
ncbi:MAG: FecR domain-containing protein [Pseudomonadota bacterium]